ncbi:MAG: PQQ-binding-like beta-propeller repeat protein, partial [Ignavibacteriaceae bacterium]
VENEPDSILLFEVQVDSNGTLFEKEWGGWSKNFEKNIPFIDSLQFIKYSDIVNVLWQEDLKTSMSTSLLVDGDKIFASTIDGKIHCFNLKGKLIWKYETNETIFSKPVRDNDVLATATIEGDLFTINANNGELIQVIGIGEPLTSQLIKFNIQYRDVKTTAVVVGSSNGNLFCYDLYSLEQIWENNSASLMIETEPLLINNKIIFGSWDNYLYCIDAGSGSLIWKWTENKNFYYSPAACWPVADEKNVYVSTPDKYVSAVDLLLGTTVWRKNDFSSWESIGISNDKKDLLIKSFMDKFFIVSAKDGKQIKEVELKFGLDTMPVEPTEWNGKILFGAKDGNIYMINKDYSWEPIIFTGTARAHSVQHIKDNIFAASNMDGKIFVFTIN